MTGRFPLAPIITEVAALSVGNNGFQVSDTELLANHGQFAPAWQSPGCVLPARGLSGEWAVAGRSKKGRGTRCSGRMECGIAEHLIGQVSQQQRHRRVLRVPSDQSAPVGHQLRGCRA